MYQILRHKSDSGDRKQKCDDRGRLSAHLQLLVREKRTSEGPIGEPLELEVWFLELKPSHLSPLVVLDEAVCLFDEGLDALAVDVSWPPRSHRRTAPAGRDEEAPFVVCARLAVRLDDTSEG